ncbi:MULTISPECIES: GH92 family glycosyl hydrolase [unclassified Crossiella]|uniref:GH92 family glycosyl hydrolase n=1 Tax=unclassified Crossiella TaxID=2620835 RepID=UPI001FFEC364|nr:MULTISPECIES: GH92 family glycosyl hydrolase [unclassified Crossiella]MCK2241997.1 GH92 family glycosyl hydrolase [Crossiella sp. S99.2]MCK2255900.1 GH92 family glycosyl hydrolase [Crossiella sp. S99.1]
MLVCASIVALSLAGSPVALAAPPETDQGQPMEGTSFATSFEAGEPQPTWTDTPETGPDGKPKASGVTGADSVSIPGSVNDKITATAASAENTVGGEVRDNLFDGSLASKWLAFERTGWVSLTLSEAVAVQKYAISSANDAAERDPKDWTLKGSTDGVNWTTVDSRTGESFAKRHETKTFTLTNTVPYQHYRLDITLNNGASLIQLAELQLAGPSNGQFPPYMRTVAGKGPAGGYNVRNNSGFTGSRAFRYLGTHEAKGRGYSYNKVFDVDIQVGRDTELSYLIFPEFVSGDMNYPSTHAALDLAFADGTYLSDLKATDQHGFELSPRGQGASKVLYTNQWNLQQSVIGKVAAGKTIKRILVAYDNPNGPASFSGWVDDIRVGTAPKISAKRPSEHVITTRGTNSSSNFSRGNNFPATAVPHGFNFWSPMTNAGTTSWLYEYAKANNPQNLPTLQAFTASHQPSPWMGDRQTFQVMPSAEGTPKLDRAARALPFKHVNETAQAHYYGVTFENGMKTEIAPTDHAALFRFTFTGDTSSLLFDNVNNNGGLTLDPATGTVSGFSDIKSGLSTGATRLFVHATFDRPAVAGGKLTGAGRDNVTGYLRFDTPADNRTVTMRIATSLLSVEQAKKNLALEVSTSDTFDSVKERAQTEWDKQLRVIEVEGATQDQLHTLYSNLYRLFLYPNSGHENVGSKDKPVLKHASPVAPPTGPDTPVSTGAKIVDGKIYVNNGFWDTYRTTWPAYSLFTPKKAGEMAEGFVQQYKEGGWVSRWSSPGYANLMVGTSSDVAFADAYRKGVTNFDVRAAYDAAVKNATVAPPNPGVGRKGLDTSVFLGYTSTNTGEGMSWALDGYINDYGIAVLAKTLYEEARPNDPRRKEFKENYEYFLNRAQNYVNMFDSKVGFFQGRKPDGSWRVEPDKYEPREWGHDYTETNAWNMAFHAPQDGQGLANLYGGRDKLAAKLDKFFSTPETAEFPGSYGGIIHEMIEARDVRMGQYGHSNQPSHHITYMYDYVGQPWKTQEKVREVLSRQYTGSTIGQGYGGDEDNGELSAWWLFSALGFYPLQMGNPSYAIGSPLFTKATVHLENSKDLVIKAPKNSLRNVYVQGLKVNGRNYGKTDLPHELIAKGGTLEFDMGDKPSRWGTDKDAAPKSITEGSAVPAPLRDAEGTRTASVDVTPLTDNSSATEIAFPGKTGWVQFQPKVQTDPVTFYTLTSGKAEADPSGWVLKGSYDGKNWATVDERKNEKFAWRQHTRAFKVANPGRYSQYRLEITGGAGATVSVAEVEFLSKPAAKPSKEITGKHEGPLTVTEGTTVLRDAEITGPVTIAPGATLHAYGSRISGPLSATGAAGVVLFNSNVSGPISITGTTGELSIESTRIEGPVTLVGNTAQEAPVVSASGIQGPVTCAGNTTAPVDNGFDNTGTGPRTGQCQDL